MMTPSTALANSPATTAEWRQQLERARRALAVAQHVTVPTAHVRPMPGQPRDYFGQDALQRLADSMAMSGQISPGIMRYVTAEAPVRYEIMDGERRWRAARLRGLEYRALLVTCDDATAAFIIAAVANFNRESHTPMEVSNAIANMVDKVGIPMTEVPGILGISMFWAVQMYGLQKLIPVVKNMLDPTLPKGKLLPVTAAVQISKVDPSLQYELARKVLVKAISLRGLRGEAVRVSRHAGTKLRERVLPPGRRWDSIAALSNQVCRTTKDLNSMLDAGEYIRMVVSECPVSQIELICKSLNAAAKAAQEASAKLATLATRTRTQ
jgi:ParB family chromosome partitioning protein